MVEREVDQSILVEEFKDIFAFFMLSALDFFNEQLLNRIFKRDSLLTFTKG